MKRILQGLAFAISVMALLQPVSAKVIKFEILRTNRLHSKAVRSLQLAPMTVSSRAPQLLLHPMILTIRLS